LRHGDVALYWGMLSKYSHSALDAYRTCPQQFKFAYLDKVQTEKRVTADAFMGNAVHRALNHLYEVASYEKLLPKEDLVAYYDRIWEEADKEHLTVVKESLGVDDYIRTGRSMLEKYYEKHQPFSEGTTIGLELMLSFLLPGTSARFSARVDRLWQRPDGVVATLPRGGRYPKFFFQMGIYQLAVQETYPPFDQIELAQYFLKLDQVVRHRMSPEELDELVAELKHTIAETIHAEKLDTFPTSEGPLCDYCAYFNLCPAKRHRLLLKREGGEAKDKEEITTAEAAAELAEKFLELDARIKSLKGEHEALKGQLSEAARTLEINKLQADSGTVSVSRKMVDRFVTKTVDRDGFANLTFLVRQLGLDDYLQPDTNALMKDIYGKGRLSEEDEKKLAEYIIRKEEIRVAARHKKTRVDDND